MNGFLEQEAQDAKDALKEYREHSDVIQLNYQRAVHELEETIASLNLTILDYKEQVSQLKVAHEEATQDSITILKTLTRERDDALVAVQKAKQDIQILVMENNKIKENNEALKVLVTQQQQEHSNEITALSFEKGQLEIQLKGANDVIAAHERSIAELRRLLENQQPPKPLTFKQAFTIPGMCSWISTGYHIQKGDVLEIKASGNICYDDKGHWCGVKGTDWCTGDDPMPKQRHGCLIGKIDRSSQGQKSLLFPVGEHFLKKQIPPGELLLGVNDKWVAKNSGEFSATVTITRKEPHA